MSKPRYIWWPYVKNMIRKYPELRNEYESLHESHITTVVSSGGHSGDVSKPTEQVALREMSLTKQKEYDAVTRAIGATKRKPNAESRMQLVTMVFWKGRTIEEASRKIKKSWRTAAEWHREFVREVAKQYGFFD